MRLILQDLAMQVTPARAAAFGAAVGGLFALLALDLVGPASVADLMPAWAFPVLTQAVGAAIAWADAIRRPVAR